VVLKGREDPERIKAGKAKQTGRKEERKRPSK
jgi:hypothetical protein